MRPGGRGLATPGLVVSMLGWLVFWIRVSVGTTKHLPEYAENVEDKYVDPKVLSLEEEYRIMRKYPFLENDKNCGDTRPL